MIFHIKKKCVLYIYVYEINLYISIYFIKEIYISLTKNLVYFFMCLSHFKNEKK